MPDWPVLLVQGTADWIAMGQTVRYLPFVPRSRFRPLLAAGHAPQAQHLPLGTLRVEAGAKTAALMLRAVSTPSTLQLSPQRTFAVPDGEVIEAGGVRLDQRYVPLDRIGVCVPGGAAAYPSTVMMTVIPAQVAGVAEIALLAGDGAGRVDLDGDILAGDAHGGLSWGAGTHSIVRMGAGEREQTLLAAKRTDEIGVLPQP